MERMKISRLVGLIALPWVAWGAPMPTEPTLGVEPVERFRIGPFYEERVERDGTRFTALRPFFSYARRPESDASVTDVLWPLAHWTACRDRYYGRFANTAWSRETGEQTQSHFFTLFPLWFHGRNREYESYFGLFPLYGHLPAFAGVAKNVDFTLFPLYLAYTTAGSRAIRTRYLLFPLLSWQTDGASPEPREIERTGIFPFAGTRRDGQGENSYILWPFWSRAHYDSDLRQGSAWMLWPLAARIDTSTESGWLFLPPIIRHTRGPAQRLTRIWPLFEYAQDPEREKFSLWPIYGQTAYETHRHWYALWPLIAGATRQSQHLQQPETTRFVRLFPLWFSETVERAGQSPDQPPTTLQRYVRLWPLYSRIKHRDGSQSLRIPDLYPLRNAAGIERNLAPLWTLYEFRRNPDGTADNFLFWGLIHW